MAAWMQLLSGHDCMDAASDYVAVWTVLQLWLCPPALLALAAGLLCWLHDGCHRLYGCHGAWDGRCPIVYA